MPTTLERVKAEDGIELQGLLYTPKKYADTVVLHCHGMAGNFYENRYVNVTGLKLAARGVAFCAMNNRGHDAIADLIKEKKGKVRYKRIGQVYERVEDSIKDIAAWVALLRRKGFSNIILEGHSLGAVKAVLFARRHQKQLAALILASPPDMLGLARNEKDSKRKMKEAKTLVRKRRANAWLREKVFDGYHISAGTYLNLFGDGSAADTFPIAANKAPEELLNIQLPMLIVFGEKDDCTVCTPREAIDYFKKRVPAAQTRIISGANHVYLNREEAFADAVLAFVQSVA